MFRLGKKTLVFNLDFRVYIARKKILMCLHRKIQKHLRQVSKSLNLAYHATLQTSSRNPFLGHFANFDRFCPTVIFPKEPGSIAHNPTWSPNTIPSFRKNNAPIPTKVSDRRTNIRTTEGRTDGQS